MPDPSKPTPEQNPPQPLTDPTVPPMRDPPGTPYRDPVQPPPNDPPDKPLHDPDPPPVQGSARAGHRRRRWRPGGDRGQSDSLRSSPPATAAHWPTTLTEESAIAAAAMIGESRMPNTG